MPGDEKELQYKIVSTADTAGAEKNTAALKETTAAAKEATAATEQLAQAREKASAAQGKTDADMASKGGPGRTVPIDRENYEANLKRERDGLAAAAKYEEERTNAIERQKRRLIELEDKANKARLAGNTAEEASLQRKVQIQKVMIALQRDGLYSEAQARAYATTALRAEEARTLQKREQAAINRQIAAQDAAELAMARSRAAAEKQVATSRQQTAVAAFRGATNKLGLGLAEVGLAGGFAPVAAFLAMTTVVLGAQKAVDGFHASAEKAAERTAEAAEREKERLKEVAETIATNQRNAKAEADSLLESLNKVTAALDRQRAAADALLDSETQLQLAQADEKEETELATAGSDPVVQARIKADAAVARARIRNDAEIKKAVSERATREMEVHLAASTQANAGVLAAKARQEEAAAVEELAKKEAALAAAQKAGAEARAKLRTGAPYSSEERKLIDQAGAQGGPGGDAAVAGARAAIAAERKAAADAAAGREATALAERDEAKTAYAKAQAARIARSDAEAEAAAETREATQRLRMADNRVQAKSISGAVAQGKAMREGKKDVAEAEKDTEKKEEQEEKKKRDEETKAEKERKQQALKGLDAKIRAIEADTSDKDSLEDFTAKVKEVVNLKARKLTFDDDLTREARTDAESAFDREAQEKITRHGERLAREAEKEEKERRAAASKKVEARAERRNRTLTPEQKEREIERELGRADREADRKAELARLNSTGFDPDFFKNRPGAGAAGGDGVSQAAAETKGAADTMGSAAQEFSAAGQTHAQAAAQITAAVATVSGNFNGLLAAVNALQAEARSHAIEIAGLKAKTNRISSQQGR